MKTYLANNEAVLLDRKVDNTSIFEQYKYQLMALTALVLLAIFWGFSSSSSIAEKDLVYAKVNNGAINKSTTGIGKITALQSWQISAEQSGSLIEVLKQPGAMVAKSQTILRLKNPRLQEQLESLTEDLTLLRTELLSTKLRLNAEYTREQNDSKKMRLRLNTAEQELQASQELATSGIISALQLATIKAKTEEARLDLTMSKSTLAAKKKIIEAEILLKKGSIKRKQAEVNNLNNRIEMLNVKSPISGILQSVEQSFGALITEGKALATVSDTSQMKAVFYLPEQDINTVTQDKEVLIRSSQGEFTTAISLINPSIKDGAIEVEALLPDNFPAWIKPDLPIQVVISHSSGQAQIYVKKPNQAVSHSQSTLYRLDRKKQSLVAVTVEFGDIFEDFIEIKSGLSHDDIIVVSSAFPLEGSEVMVNKGAQ